MGADQRFVWCDTTRILGGDAASTANLAGLFALQRAIAAGAPFAVSGNDITLDATTSTSCFTTTTGGTTGAPRVIRRSQASWIASFEVNRARFGLTAHDRVAILGQLGHSLALYAALEAAHIGADILMLAGQRPDRQAASIAAQAATVIYATPTQLRALCRGAEIGPNVRHILCGGGALGAGDRDRAARAFPNAALTVFYGAAETSFVAMSDALTPAGSVGRPYPGVTIDIRNAGGRPTDETGEVWVQSPYLFDSYLGDGSPETRQSGGFVTVGELGWLDAAGNLFLKGRRNRVVSVADQNVYPEDAEAVLLADGAVANCAVLPVADPARGQVLVAVIAARADAALRDRLLRACRQQLGALRAPRRIVFVDDFPQLASGKPDLGALRTLLEAQP